MIAYVRTHFSASDVVSTITLHTLDGNYLVAVTDCVPGTVSLAVSCSPSPLCSAVALQWSTHTGAACTGPGMPGSGLSQRTRTGFQSECCSRSFIGILLYLSY